MLDDSIVAAIADLKWPIVLLITLFLFKAPIRELLSRLSNLSITAGDFKLETALRGRVSSETLREIRKQPGYLRSSVATHQQVTVLHLETQGFSVLSETMSPEEIADYLHIYLTRMTDVVFEFGGTIDRYEGTALTAYWGAPIVYPDSANRACKAALRMHGLIKELSPKLEAKGYPPLLPLFALTTANVIAGNLGSDQKPAYSILGDYSYILASLVRLNNNYQTNILMTNYTLELVEGEFNVRLLGEQIKTKGKDQPVSVYELCGEKAVD